MIRLFDLLGRAGGLFGRAGVGALSGATGRLPQPVEAERPRETGRIAAVSAADETPPTAS